MRLTSPAARADWTWHRSVRKLRRPGTRSDQTSRRLVASPQVKSDIAAGLSVCHSASAAAIFTTFGLDWPPETRLMLVFFIGHVYMAAFTGHPWYSYLKGMVTGYEEVEQ